MTGGRRVGVLLNHSFTGQPPRSRRGARRSPSTGTPSRCRACPGTARPGGAEHPHLGRLVRRADEGSRQAGRRERRGGRGRVVDGGALSCGWPPTGRVDIAGVVVVNPAVATKRFDVRRSRSSKHVVKSFPASQRHQSARVATSTATPAPRSRRALMMQAWPGLVADLPKVTAPLLYFRSTRTTSWTRRPSRSSPARSRRPT